MPVKEGMNPWSNGIVCVALYLALSVAAASRDTTAGSDSVESARHTYRALALASGDSRQAPSLEIRSDADRARTHDGRRVSWFDPRKNTIGIDDKVLQLCSGMQGHRADSCVALFLGHELAHFYRDHGWGADFGSRFAGSGVAAEIQAKEASAEQMLRYEIQADETGGVLGYLAGFDTLGVADSALKAVYQSYGLDEELRGYPNLGERLNLAQRSKDNLEKLLPLFDAGNLLFMIGRYEESGRVFDVIAREFPSREILNNAGVARALQAAALFPEAAMATFYPWSIDGQTRLQSGAQVVKTRGGGEAVEAKRARLLEEAHDRLTDATRRDPEYALALINLACVEELRRHRGTAIDLADSAIEIATKKQQPALVKLARLARAIAVLHGENPEKGRAELAKIDTAGDPLLSPWLGKARSKVRDTGSQSVQSTSVEETIGGLRARDLAISTASNPVTIPPLNPGESEISISSKWTNSYVGLVIKADSFRVAVLISSSDYQGKSARSIALDSPWPAVLKEYGSPDQRQPFAGGACSLYRQQGLIVCTDDQERVNRWALYAFQQ